LVELDAVVGQGEREHFSRAAALFRWTGGGQQSRILALPEVIAVGVGIMNASDSKW
jgi:hypothetical protein